MQYANHKVSLLCLQNLKAPQGAAFTITGNTLLQNISALYNVGQCKKTAPYNTVNVPVSLQVRLSGGSTCTLSSWKGVCAYIGSYNAAHGPITSCPKS